MSGTRLICPGSLALLPVPTGAAALLSGSCTAMSRLRVQVSVGVAGQSFLTPAGFVYLVGFVYRLLPRLGVPGRTKLPAGTGGAEVTPMTQGARSADGSGGMLAGGAGRAPCRYARLIRSRGRLKETAKPTRGLHFWLTGGTPLPWGCSRGIGWKRHRCSFPELGKQRKKWREGRQRVSKGAQSPLFLSHVTAHKAGNSHGLLTAF